MSEDENSFADCSDEDLKVRLAWALKNQVKASRECRAAQDRAEAAHEAGRDAIKRVMDAESYVDKVVGEMRRRTYEREE